MPRRLVISGSEKRKRVVEREERREAERRGRGRIRIRGRKLAKRVAKVA